MSDERIGSRCSAFAPVSVGELSITKPIHPLRVVGHPSTVGEIHGVADHRWADTEKIGVERYNDVGLEVVDGVAGRAGRLTQADVTIGRDGSY